MIYLTKIMGYILKKHGIYLEKRDILGKIFFIYFGIYRFKIVGYIWQNYGIY